MCVICVSGCGVPQPTKDQIKTMFQTNPDGAGYMVARAGRVEIHKGFMTCETFLSALAREKFTAADAVVYHFRISTQAGVTRAMTHPFPLTRNITDCKQLDAECALGVAHNGIIRLTSNACDREYNDTAYFIAEYMSFILRSKKDMQDKRILDIIENLTHSKFALLYKDGTISTIGSFICEKNGLLFSNPTYRGFNEMRYLIQDTRGWGGVKGNYYIRQCKKFTD